MLAACRTLIGVRIALMQPRVAATTHHSQGNDGKVRGREGPRMDTGVDSIGAMGRSTPRPNIYGATLPEADDF